MKNQQKILISSLRPHNSSAKYPRAILHIDGDAFFASCEQARNPNLRGKPVVTGLERGIAASMSYEAKARGITRAMQLSDIKKICPETIILPSDYEAYSLLSHRFYAIVRRYTDTVEEYGIDECFAEITGLERPLKKHYRKIAECIQNDLSRELGFTFSIGLASTKVLAKVGSKWQKPHGLTCIPNKHISRYLGELAISSVWGIGPQTSALMYHFGIFKALDFAQKEESWVDKNFSKPFQEIWHELRGESVLPLLTEGRTTHYSVQKMRTFTPPSTDRDFVFSQLAKNIESACMRARQYQLEAKKVHVLLRTQKFEHSDCEVTLSRPTNFPHDILKAVRPIFDELFRPRIPYRATMITLLGLEVPLGQPDLFGTSVKVEGYRRLYAGVDHIRKKYGKHTVHLGASYLAQKFAQPAQIATKAQRIVAVGHQNERRQKPQRHRQLLKGESRRKRLNLPVFLGAID